jgi:hypothetical protein
MFLMHMGQKKATSSVLVAQKATISIIRVVEQGVWCIVASLAAPSPSRLFGAVMAAAKTRCDHGVGMEEGVWHRGGRVVERSKGSA